MLSNMDSTMCLKLVQYADNNCITLKTGVKDEDRLRGSNNLVKYILANNKTVIQQQRAKQQELETARLASLAESTKEKNNEDDVNMERPLRRQRLEPQQDEMDQVDRAEAHQRAMGIHE